MNVKIFGTAMMLLLVFSFLPAVMAEEVAVETTSIEVTSAEPELVSADPDGAEPELVDAELTEEDEEEIELFNEALGAEMRLLQLEKSLTRNILSGTQVLDVLIANHPEEDLSELELILEDLEGLLEEVKALDAEADNAVETFVDIKKESITLSKEFRELVRAIGLTAEDRALLKESRKDVAGALSEYNDSLKTIAREMNANRVRNMLKKMGATDDELVDDVLAGDATRAKVAIKLRTKFRSLSTDEKQSALRAVKEERVAVRAAVIKKAKVVAEKLGPVMTARVAQTTSNRLENRSNYNQRASDIAERRGFEVVSNRLQVRSDRLETASNRMQDVAKRIKNRRLVNDEK